MGQHLIKTKYLGHGVKLFFSYSCNTECEGGILFGVIFSVNQRHSKITPFLFIQKKKKKNESTEFCLHFNKIKNTKLFSKSWEKSETCKLV